MAHLPFTAVTRSGTAYDVQFPLHPQTVSEQDVQELLSTVLDAVSARVEGARVSDGDVLQALVMVLAIRMRMVDAPLETCGRLVDELLERSIAAVEQARSYPMGRA
jgi:hypothetical protein